MQQAVGNAIGARWCARESLGLTDDRDGGTRCGEGGGLCGSSGVADGVGQAASLFRRQGNQRAGLLGVGHRWKDGLRALRRLLPRGGGRGEQKRGETTCQQGSGDDGRGTLGPGRLRTFTGHTG